MSFPLGDGILVTVASPAVPVVQAAPPIAGTVLALPVAGPPGPPGSSFTYNQPTPAATWTIVHGLGRYPVPTILPTGSAVPVFTDAAYPDANTLVLTFPSPLAGKAFL